MHSAQHGEIDFTYRRRCDCQGLTCVGKNRSQTPGIRGAPVGFAVVYSLSAMPASTIAMLISVPRLPIHTAQPLNVRRSPVRHNARTEAQGKDCSYNVSYFKAMAEESGIPYQSLINLYLRDCAINHRKLEMNWTSE